METSEYPACSLLLCIAIDGTIAPSTINRFWLPLLALGGYLSIRDDQYGMSVQLTPGGLKLVQYFATALLIILDEVLRAEVAVEVSK